MTALTSTAIAVVRNRFGIYADAIMALRAAGETVAPYSDKFRVGTGGNMWVCTGDEIIALAAKLQARQEASRKRKENKEPAAGHRPVGAHEGTPEASRDGSVRADYSDATPCGCVDGNGSGSTPPDPVVPPVSKSQAGGAVTPTAKPVPTAGIGAGTNHESCGLCPVLPGGVVPDKRRKWPPNEGASRAFGGTAREHSSASRDDALAMDTPATQCGDRAPPGPQAHSPTPQAPRRCSKCGGPRSRWANDLCRKCYRARLVAPKAQAVRIAALECEVDALKSVVNRLLKFHSTEQGR